MHDVFYIEDVDVHKRCMMSHTSFQENIFGISFHLHTYSILFAENSYSLESKNSRIQNSPIANNRLSVTHESCMVGYPRDK